MTQLSANGVITAFANINEEDYVGNEFGEMVATNRGIRGKIFNSVDEAKKWLLKD